MKKIIVAVAIAVFYIASSTALAQNDMLIFYPAIIQNNAITIQPQLSAENGIINAIPNSSATSRVIVPTGQPSDYSFTIASSTLTGQELTIDASGRVTATPNATRQSGALLPFTITTRQLATNKSFRIEGQVYILTSTTLAQGSITPGQTAVIADAWKDVAVTIPAAAATGAGNLRILRSVDADGDPMISFALDNANAVTGPLGLYLPNASVLQGGTAVNTGRLRQKRTSVADAYDWEATKTEAYFLNSLLFTSSQARLHQIPATDSEFLRSLTISRKVASIITSNCRDDASALGRTPVIFVHGYTQGDSLGGGSDTWDRFAELLATDLPGCAFFEFKWRTNARFQDVANDFSNALRYVAQKTNRQAHIVAHSFGGILTRTALQHLNAARLDTSLIASVTTIGTPHSGISDTDNQTYHGVSFPHGQDNELLFNAGRQISMHQMGEYVNEAEDYAWLGVSATPGEVAAAISNLQTYPFSGSLPIQVLMGLNKNFWSIGSGDGLISFAGQRFRPDARSTATLYNNQSAFGAVLWEKILGFDAQTRPGQSWKDCQGDDDYGYIHSPSIRGTNFGHGTPEVFIGSKTRISYIETLNFIKAHPAGPITPETLPLQVHVVDTANQPISGATLWLATDISTLNAQATSDASGNASFSIPFTANTPLDAFARKIGYKTEMHDNGYRTGATLAASSQQFGTIVMQSDTPQSCTIRASIRNSRNDQAIPNAQWSLYRNDFLLQSGTAANGTFTVSDVAQGTYRVDTTANGYHSSSQSISVTPSSQEHSILLSPINTGAANIVLTWNVDPRDLDSHLSKYSASGSLLYHIYFSNRTDQATGDSLDHDDTTSYGPETVTINNVDPSARYVYYVHHYAGSGSISSTSGAVVRITDQYGSTTTYGAPSTGSGSKWNVFEIVNGTITPCTGNCISATNDLRTRSAVPDAVLQRGEAPYLK